MQERQVGSRRCSISQYVFSKTVVEPFRCFGSQMPRYRWMPIRPRGEVARFLSAFLLLLCSGPHPIPVQPWREAEAASICLDPEKTMRVRPYGNKTNTTRWALCRTRPSTGRRSHPAGHCFTVGRLARRVCRPILTLETLSSSRSYKDSLKEAQSKVLRSTSLKQNSSPVRSSRAVYSPNPASRGSRQPPPLVGNHPPSEKKGPKTRPKPPSIGAAVPSPHTPKERHVVGPETRGPSPPALPDVAAVGTPAVLRIGGRKRLTPGQKKRSYSEPDNMNEIGISDSERGLFKLGGGKSNKTHRTARLVQSRF